MIRTLIYFSLVAVAIAVAYLLVIIEPGEIAVQWLGWQVQTSIAIAILALIFLCALAAVVYHGWRLLRRAPRDFWNQQGHERRNRGYRALSHGLVAVAAGDPHEARRWAKKAEKLLDDQPLSRLLSAQAAQLSSDAETARLHFEKMLEAPETRFLGLRGLLMQSLRDGDDAAALEYLRQAKDLRPDTPWVIDHLFEVAQRRGDLKTAEQAALAAARYAVWPREDAYRKRAVLLTARAERAAAQGDATTALQELEEALKSVPDLVPAAVLRARLEGARGKERRGAKLLETAWKRQPHPDLAEAYLALRPQETPLSQVKRIEKLTAGAPDHLESRVARGRAALAAELWGEARKHLQLAGGPHADRRVCRLMAEIEQREHDNREAAHDWLRRAEQADLEPMWVCDTCGAATRNWTADCGQCGSFDSLTWRSPLQALNEAMADEETPEVSGKNGGQDGDSRDTAPTLTSQAVVISEKRTPAPAA